MMRVAIPLANVRRQCLAVDKTTCDVVGAADLTRFVNRDNIRMPQLGSRPCFSKESLGVFFIRQYTQPRDFQRDQAIQLWIVSFEDSPESPRTDLLDDPESTELVLRRRSVLSCRGVWERHGA